MAGIFDQSLDNMNISRDKSNNGEAFGSDVSANKPWIQISDEHNPIKEELEFDSSNNSANFKQENKQSSASLTKDKASIEPD